MHNIFVREDTKSPADPCGCALAVTVRIPRESWVSVFCECCVLSGRGLCDGPITPPEESYRVVCLSMIRCISNPLHLQ